jgi:hypothetical protein
MRDSPIIAPSIVSNGHMLPISGKRLIGDSGADFPGSGSRWLLSAGRDSANTERGARQSWMREFVGFVTAGGRAPADVANPRNGVPPEGRVGRGRGRPDRVFTSMGTASQ